MRKGRIVRAYEWFLELPVTVVLVVLWLAGVGLVVLGALVLYLCWDFLRAVVGSLRFVEVLCGDAPKCVCILGQWCTVSRLRP